LACASGPTSVKAKGHWYYATTGDGLIAALQLLSVVKGLGKPVSEVCHCFEPLPQILKSVRYADGQPLKNDAVVTAIESARQRLGTQGRLVIRPSGTEPVIRVMGEGDDPDLVAQVVDDVVNALAHAA
jgi:phosphoglucosamine mutase